MAKVKKIDPVDGLVISEVGEWAPEKHARVSRYIEIASVVRKEYRPPPEWRAGAAYIELFSGPGRSLIRGTSRIIDGSPLIAFKSAQASGVPFTEMHRNDANPEMAAAVGRRVKALGFDATWYAESADVAVDQIISALNPAGLHFAFLDPFNLEDLSFEIIRKLSRLRRIDMLIHVSVQDLQRNLDRFSAPGGVLDTFAPGWRSDVDPNQAIHAFRSSLLQYWLREIQKLGTMPAKGVELIVGSKRQRLYWLVFVSAHSLAQRLWDAIRDPTRQSSMEF
ncbi:three-Cys-motif partner protein TcmP [Bradyrhizobium sp.]|uniref:three-Cys-motif partner protein TcmP n=1 Tax=Bradyrhizobium sp. TaxID=376 RepID=UPI001EB69366|nr:three-Cys-motif partner protein TcmP [Bradyrhizobium sp.]MBV8918112.1 three-Cys-motif partner protein TcmP [Bradyrhizobium sp.]MBV9982450.1 three-Cys-motif partner protein TcmP [Bradyrhizobium sp.]